MAFFMLVAWRNIWRNTRRTLITTLAMAISVGICIAMVAVTNGFYDVFFDLMVTKKLGHVQIRHEDYPKTKAMYDTVDHGDDIIAALNELESSKGYTARLYGSALVSKDSQASGAQVTGVLPEMESTLLGIDQQIKEGRYLAHSAQKEVIVGMTLRDELDLKVDEELFVYTQASDGSMAYDLYNIVGVYSSGSTMLDRGIQLHVRDVQELLLMPKQYHEILVTGTEDADVAELSAVIQSKVADLPVKAPLSISTWWESSPQTKEMMAFQDASSYMFLGIIFFIAGFGILNTMLMSVFERTRELGVMKALGMRPNKIVLLVVVESVVLAALASVMGMALGLFLNYLLNIYGLDMSGGTGEPLAVMGMNMDPIMRAPLMNLSSYMIPVGGMFLITILASLWPAYRASQLDPVDAIRSE